MKKHYQILFILLTICLSTPLFAQHITGEVKDEQGKAISFANVALLNASDSALITGSVTGFDGKFQLKSPENGRYILRLTAISFVTSFTPVIEVNKNNFTKDFGSMILQEDVKVLGAVEVKAMRPSVTVEAGKMIVSVENTALAAGSTAYEVLAKSPGVWADPNGDIQLNGKAGVRIMLDGRSTYLSSEELRTMLQSMSAENIKNIELITNPSAKYDAEGSSGIINIQLKKNLANGINGSVHGGYTYNGTYAYSSGANINLKKGKWNSSAKLEFNRFPLLRDLYRDREFYNEQSERSTYEQFGQEERRYYTPSLRLGTDLELNDQHSFGALLNIAGYRRLKDSDTDTYMERPTEKLLIKADNDEDRQNLNSTFNLHYDGEYGDQTLSANLDFIRFEITNEANFNNTLTDRDTKRVSREDLALDNLTTFEIYSARIDYGQNIFGNTELDLGAKASQVTSGNSLDYFILEEQEKRFDKNRSSRFTYREQILAAYVNFNTQLSEEIKLQAGLRTEHTTGYDLVAGEKMRQYLDFFPSVFLQHTVSDNYQINYSLSRRIDRPRYTSLNPFVYYMDPYTVIQGNPNLKPEYTNAVQISQTFFKKYNLNFSYSKTKDYIAEVPMLNGDEQTARYSANNVDDYQEISASLVAPVRISKWWEISNNLLLTHEKNLLTLGDEKVENSALYFRGQSTHHFQLPWSIRMEVNAGYASPSTWGIYQMGGYWWTDAGFKRSFLKDKMHVGLSFSDIFRSRQETAIVEVERNMALLKQYLGHQSVRFSLRYTFSKGDQFKNNSRKQKIEELRRAGG